MKANKYGDAIQAWMKISRIFETTTGAFKTRPCRKFSKSKLYYITRNPEEWITDIE